MKTLTRSLFIILFSVAVIGLFLCPEGRAAHELFNNMDEDHDGEISLREFREDMEEHAFRKMDADEDQVVAEKEWKSIDVISDMEKHMELFERIDRNKDRRITFLEFSDYADKSSNLDEAFMGLDKDGSNSLSQDEITVRPLFRLITIRFW